MWAFWRKNPYLSLFLLCFIGLTLRLTLMWGNTIPYMFDHARDSIEVMTFLKTGKPMLIGPRASIDGLFFGPAWYYLISPFYWWGDGHPVSPVGAVTVLYLLEVCLAHRYFGKWPAIIMTFTPGWWWISTSAWNPFPLALISLLILIVLKKSGEGEKLNTRLAAILGFVSALGFHFSTAYALFYPLIILVAFWMLKVKWRLKELLMFSLAFMLPWLPQIAFEVRHDFLQTKSVIAYLSSANAIEFSITRTFQTFGTISSSLFWASAPSEALLPQSWKVTAGVIFTLLFLGLFLWSFKAQKPKKDLKDEKFLIVCWLFILIPIIGYVFLHFSVWYVVGMYPAGAVIASKFISKRKKSWQDTILIIYILAALFSVGKFVLVERAQFLIGKNFLHTKMNVIKTVRELAGNEPFSSYQFVPDVYDYTYQYLYFWQAQHGWVLPVEFSYQPDVIPYYPQKEAILASFSDKIPPAGTKPTYIFFIVEKPEYQNVLDEWWTRQMPHEVVKEVKMSDELTIYQAVVK